MTHKGAMKGDRKNQNNTLIIMDMGSRGQIKNILT